MNLLTQALQLHQTGQWEQAERLYREILRTDSGHADALHLLGVLALQQGDAPRATQLISRAIAARPADPVFHFNLAHAYKQQGDLDAAARHYRDTLDLKPHDADAYNNLGGVLLAAGDYSGAADSFARACALQPDDTEVQANHSAALHACALQAQETGDYGAAFEHYRRALELTPGVTALHVDLGTWFQEQDRPEQAALHYRQALTLDAHCNAALNNLGALHHRQGDFESAEHYYRAALALDMQFAPAHKNLAGVLHLRADAQNAIAHYREALRLQPDYPEAEYELAALLGDSRAAPPAGYVAALFDGYAHEYDHHMSDVLGYTVPRQLRALAEAHVAQRALSVLDLGCGTGLGALAFEDVGHTFVGVDLAPKMIAQAHGRALYDRLITADVCTALAQLDETFDLVLAADVFVYLGDLAPVFAAVRRVLNTAGLFVFSVESGAGTAYTLQAAGRYAHAPVYLRALARQFQFQELALNKAVLRKDYGKEVEGLLAVLQTR